MVSLYYVYNIYIKLFRNRSIFVDIDFEPVAFKRQNMPLPAAAGGRWAAGAVGGGRHGQPESQEKLLTL